MSNIVIDYLNSKRKPVGKVETDDQHGRLKLSVSNHIVTLYLQAAKKKDAAMLALVDTDLKETLRQYLGTMYSNRSRIEVAGQITNHVHRTLLSEDFKSKPIPAEQFEFLKAHLSWMNDYAYIFSQVIRSDYGIRKELFEFNVLTDKQLASILLSGTNLTFKKERLAQLYDNLPDNLKENLTALLLYDHLRSAGTLTRQSQMQLLLESRGVKIPGSVFDYTEQYYKEVHASDLDQLVELTTNDVGATPFHQQYLDKVIEQKGLKSLLGFTKEVDESLFVQPDLSRVKVDFDTPLAKAKYLNTEFEVCQLIAKRLDYFSGALMKHPDKFDSPEQSRVIAKTLIEFFAFASISRMSVFSSTNRFTRNVQNYDFNNFPNLLAHCINLQQVDKLPLLRDIAQNAPHNLIAKTLMHLDLSEQECAWFSCESISRKLQDKLNTLDNVAKVIASAKLKYQNICDIKIGNRGMYIQGDLSQYPEGQLSIKRLLENKLFTDNVNFILDKSDVYYLRTVAEAGRKVIESSTPTEKADMTFLNGKSI